MGESSSIILPFGTFINLKFLSPQGVKGQDPSMGTGMITCQWRIVIWHQGDSYGSFESMRKTMHEKYFHVPSWQFKVMCLRNADTSDWKSFSWDQLRVQIQTRVELEKLAPHFRWCVDCWHYLKGLQDFKRNILIYAIWSPPISTMSFMMGWNNHLQYEDIQQAPFHWHHEVPCDAGDVGALLVAGELKQAFDS